MPAKGKVKLITELDSLIKLLEARIPASPAANEKLEKALQRDLADYFRQLGMAIDFNQLEQLYYKHVEQE